LSPLNPSGSSVFLPLAGPLPSDLPTLGVKVAAGKASLPTSHIRQFTVPSCCGRHDLVSTLESNRVFIVTRLDASQVTNLVLGHTYVSDVFSSSGMEYRSIAVHILCSEGIVVITVLLSITMFVLVSWLITVPAIMGVSEEERIPDTQRWWLPLWR
uniref:Uncharacterized protein n=1 Tax=Pelusios castaneus TaxID=367368 RepID=A0A8C8RVN1_9SAUR